MATVKISPPKIVEISPSVKINPRENLSPRKLISLWYMLLNKNDFSLNLCQMAAKKPSYKC